MTAESPAQTEDLLPVRSRISWGAILAGSVLAVALSLLLGLLGTATGLSLGDRVSNPTLGNSAALFAVFVTAVCLFAGGYVASQLTAGENAVEGSLYGIFVWATVFAMLVALAGSGVRIGASALAGVASAGRVAADNTTQGDWEATARQAGVPQDRIEEWKQRAKDAPAAARDAANDPQTRQAVADGAARTAWYAFFGAWVSMMAAAAGGYLGSGATVRVVTTPVARSYPDNRPVTPACRLPPAGHARSPRKGVSGVRRATPRGTGPAVVIVRPRHGTRSTLGETNLSARRVRAVRPSRRTSLNLSTESRRREPPAPSLRGSRPEH
jgi:hypothetical protein